MNWNNYAEFLLSSIPGAKLVSGGTTVNCRCRECPDSRNPSSAHFYISIPKNEDEPSLYYCHKCGCSGIVTHNTLINWGIYDKQIALELGEYNNKISKNPKSKKYFNHQTYLLSHSYTTMDDKSEEKRQYIVDRLGYNLSYHDLNQLKICLNLKDLLNENKIFKLSRNENIVNELDREFVGFISIDNAFINLRRTCPEGIVYKEIDKRYVNYKLFDKFSTEQRFYTIPTVVNLNRPTRTKLHIAEGPFDILSIYLNCRNKEEGIYTSVTGNNYLNIIMYFLITYQLPFIELHLYPDNDKFGDINRLKYMIDKIPDKTIPVFIHKNTYPGEKDFGVPLNKINESIGQLR